MKEYFSHDYNARNDRKLVALQMKHSLAGLGAYWALIEMLYEEGGSIPFDCERIAFEMRTQSEFIKSVLEDFNLFEIDGTTVTNLAVTKRLKLRKDKSAKAKKAAAVKWKNHHANAKRTQSESDADAMLIKVNKIKEKELKKELSNESSKKDGGVIEEKPPTPGETMRDFIEMVEKKNERYENFVRAIDAKYDLGDDIVRAELDKFVNYWTEPTKSGKKQHWELQSTFEVRRRLVTWFTNYNKRSYPPQQSAIAKINY